MARRPRPQGLTLWIGALLLSAIAIGGAAALLTAPTAPTPPSYVYPGFNLTLPEAGAIILGLIALWIGFHLYDRQQNGSFPLAGRQINGLFMILVVMIVLIVILRAAGDLSGGGFDSGRAPANNTTGGSTTPGNDTNATNGNYTGFAPLNLGGTMIPGWVLFAGLLGGGAVFAFVVVPLYLASRKVGAVPPLPDALAARHDFAQALRGLEDPAEPDVREIVIALYAKLLQRIGPALGNTEVLAPREIQEASVQRLRIQPETAHALTELFEEARYSTHALDAEAGERARRIFQDALRDIDAMRGRGAS